MDISAERGLAVTDDRKMYRETCHKLAVLVQKLVDIFPELEALQPRASGMQALCGLHWALDKAKSFLHQIVHSSKLYLAITSDSVLLKFEKVKDCLEQSLIRLQTCLPESLSEQIFRFVSELQETTCQPEALHHEAGEEIISLLQKEKEDPGFNTLTELEVFDQVASRLGIMSSKSILAEKKALRRLLSKVRSEEDKKKELIVLYLLHLLRKYSKAQQFAAVEDGSVADNGSSCPPSPSERGSEASTSGRESDYSSELSGFISLKRREYCRREALSCLGHQLIPPEEFRCPISLQLMADPVIISSGQTYERVCIEKWFEEGHDTCPKTQQKLAHLDVTPNYCVKGLIMSWCERHSLPFPSPPSPPPSVISDWRSDLFPTPAPTKCIDPQTEMVSTARDVAVFVAQEGLTATLDESKEFQFASAMAKKDSASENGHSQLLNVISTQKLLERLCSSSLDMKYSAAEEIRSMTEDNANVRLYLGEAGLIPSLVGCLSAAVNTGDERAQETACFALSNVGVDNNRNKADMVSAGVLPLLLKLLDSDTSLTTKEAAIVVLRTASSLEDNKLGIALSGTVPFLVNHLESGSPQGIKDALTTLFNLSNMTGDSSLVNSGIIPKLINLLGLDDKDLSEKCLAIICTLSSMEEGRSLIAEVEGCISIFTEILDKGVLQEKEYVVAILLFLCTGSAQISQSVLEEGVIPSLVMLSVNGSSRGKERASRLLQHFREQRQKECAWQSAPQNSCAATSTSGKNTHDSPEKAMVRRKARSFGFFRRSKSLSFYRC